MSESNRSFSADVDDTNVESFTPVIPPACLIQDEPLSHTAHATVKMGRQQAKDVLAGVDDRVLVIVGPCSIHDTVAGKEYAQKLKKLADEVAEDVLIIMRVYFEKPRTTVGWKGLINDPDLDNSYKINKGLRTARQLLIDINEIGLPCGGEFLDTISPQFLADLFSWGAIGARTTESQLHRELASGLSMAIGFKNGTDGSIGVACDACLASACPHHFLGVTKQGLAAIIHTKGNEHTHVILRGSSQGPNYSAEHIAKTREQLKGKKLPVRIMVDCSHGNSSKNHKNQPGVALNLCKQIESGDSCIIGIMIESNLVEGRQDLKGGMAPTYGQSVTDACINWADTEKLMRDIAQAVKNKRKNTALKGMK
uniref:3-deoxy-7-phosphoheptulonate synthase n=1 Tax=Eutreptiella gymnastica TaxID=73025 RepID=A0A7S4LKE6_9EUGL